MVELSLGWPNAGQTLAAAACQRWPLDRGDTTMVELLLGWPKAGCGRLSEVAA